ncbi:MAG: ABC transporter ATP-binding protein [Alphaproteobacteria bacterium]|nr:ABC transporter ATP-binding protein [Alphaproteobacteria bacterium]
MNAIVIDHVGKTYGAQAALADVSFGLQEGALLALLGHNGAGKTTLMKLMLGLIRPTSGRVEVLGCDPAGAALEFRRHLGFLPENVAFHDEMTGRDTLKFLARLKGVPSNSCAALLERVGLAPAADRRVKTYSKGMRQRLGLAQALLGHPRILLLDEPTTGLDPVLRAEFFDILAELRKGGTTVMLSSHILTELEARTEMVAIMRAGRLAAWGTLPQLRTQAAMPVRIRLSTPGAASQIADRLGGIKIAHVNDHSVDLTCLQSEKMAVLRHIAGLDAQVQDVDIHLPTLDDIYLHFGHGEVSQ